MKKTVTTGTLFLVFILTSYMAAAQPPQGINYQAVVRNTNGTIVATGTHVLLRFTIHDSTPAGNAEFAETDTAIANQFGLVTAVVGSSSALGSVNWPGGNKFLQVEAQLNNSGTFADMGTTQLQSVPYALFAPSKSPIEFFNKYQTVQPQIVYSSVGGTGEGIAHLDSQAFTLIDSAVVMLDYYGVAHPSRSVDSPVTEQPLVYIGFKIDNDMAGNVGYFEWNNHQIIMRPQYYDNIGGATYSPMHYTGYFILPPGAYHAKIHVAYYDELGNGSQNVQLMGGQRLTIMATRK